jgi:exonuclease VII large subunit
VLAGSSREVDGELRSLDRLDPASHLAATRQRAGELLDRASRAIRQRLTDAGLAHDRLATALPALAVGAVARSRADLAASGAALAVLGPQATLDRGYAIVRRTTDGSIVRTPSAAPAGTALDVRVAGGSFPATSSRPG